MSSAAPVSQAINESALRHDGLLYRTPADYVAGVVPFLGAGLAAGEPVFVAVPEANISLLRNGLGSDADSVDFVDMTSVGRNPARIIPAIRRFVDSHSHQRVRFVGEPIWPGRSDAEICEATRHEAMLNTAFADTAVDILCPYDAGQLDPAAVADAWRTHPMVVEHAERHISPHYADPRHIYAGDDPQLPQSPGGVAAITVRDDNLILVRQFVRRFVADVGLDPRRSHDLVLAVNEIATNTVLYTPAVGTLRIWSEPGTVICELRDSGFITDAFAGRHSPIDNAEHGRGLWMANQLCDLVQLRSTAAGTTIRLHVDLRAA
jgi:anti-sigma regulatory factor (Ser/Thr protein kinase)